MAGDTDTPRNKVQRVIEKRGLEGLAAELEQRWAGEDGPEHSTRELAEFFNQRVLRTALSNTGELPLDGEVENLYRLLTDDDVSTGESMQARDRLSQAGVDPDGVTDDFVSHQTVYRYLKHHRGIDTSQSSKSTTELLTSNRQLAIRLTNRTKSVIQKNIERLNQRDGFTVGDFDIFVSIRFACTDCGESCTVSQLLEQGGCECQGD